MEDRVFPDQLRIYYKRLFPYDSFYDWLSSSGDLSCREFSYTLEGDIYVRYNSYKSKQDMIDGIQKNCPLKIDIGAEYDRALTKKMNSKLLPVKKELVFDIDMTDYDDVRKCCSKTEICTKCWKYMAVACKILDAALREDFGFEHILWVFSGRRGIHCWVSDTSACHLEIPERSAIVEYLTLVSGGNYQSRKVVLPGDTLHYSVQRALNIINQNFIEMCVEEQGLLETENDVTKMVAMIHDEQSQAGFHAEIMKYSTSVDRWHAFVRHHKTLLEKGQLKKSLTNLVNEIQIAYSYPRLDVNVSKGMNHLLKAPFCVHPKTGKVCVPFNPKAVDKFNPMTVPTITALLDEISEYDSKIDPEVPGFSVSKMKDSRKTSLLKSLVVFEQFVSRLQSSRTSKQSNSERKLSF